MQVPRAEIPKFAVIDDNTIITFIVESFEKVETAGGEGSKLPAGCLMYKVGLRVAEPEKDADLMVFDNFVVGTEEDPAAELPETWTNKKAIGVRRLMEFLDAIGVTSDDSDKWENEAPEQQGQALVIVNTPDSGKYKGQPQNRISRYYSVGGAPVATTAGKPAKKAGAIAKPPTAQAAKPATAAKPTPAATAARPAARPPTTAAKAPAGANGPAKPATVTRAQPLLACQIPGCGESVTRAEFPGHYQMHVAAGEVEAAGEE